MRIIQGGFDVFIDAPVRTLLIDFDMTQEDKNILLKDLCARVPYRTFVCLNPGAYNKQETCILTGVHGEKVHLNVDSDPFRIDHIKPYLRPMSSMTEEEIKEYDEQIKKDNDYFGKVFEQPYACMIGLNALDYLLSNHFDFRELIHMGLALDAPEGMYKTK